MMLLSGRKNPVIAQILTDTFIDGLNAQNKPVARKLVKLKVANIKDALDAAVDEQLLHKSFKLRNIGGADYSYDSRDIEPMEVDAVARKSQKGKLHQLEQKIDTLTAAMQSQPQHVANENRGRGSFRGRGGGGNGRGNGRGGGRGFGRGSSRGRGRGRGRGSQPSSEMRHKWSESGRPICSHCKKEGHMMSMCWQLHPERRPQQTNSLNQ